MSRAQFFHIRKLVEIAQTKVIEEKFRRLVKKRASGNFGASGNFYEAALHQRLQDAVDRHSAHCFDIGARDRLAISDDREGLERGRSEARRFWRRKKSADPRRVFRIADQL